MTEEIEALRFNTAIARLMEFLNILTPMQERPRKLVDIFVLLLAPFAPHITEEMWSLLGHAETLAYEPWPIADSELANASDGLKEYPVQVNGKLRTKILASPHLKGSELLAAVKADPKVQHLLTHGKVVKEITVPGRPSQFRDEDSGISPMYAVIKLPVTFSVEKMVYDLDVIGRFVWKPVIGRKRVELERSRSPIA